MRSSETQIEAHMKSSIDLELYYDVRSHRARICWENEDHLLPDSFANRDAAEVAARKFVAQSMMLTGNDAAPAIRVWWR